MDKEERLSRQMEFCREIDKEKQILRQTILSNGIQREDDSQHAWHMAVMTLLLSEYSNEPIDVLKTISMLLIHDLVEIDAGDTFAYDEEGKKTQRERELRAADRIFSILPEDQRDKFRSLWDEFEEGTSPEALFAHTMDNLQPTMLNAATNGRKNVEGKTGAPQRNSQPKQNNGLRVETLWKYSLEQLIRPHVEGGQIIDDTEGRHN